MTASIAAAKTELRAIVRERLASLSPDDREGKGDRIVKAVARLDVVRRAERLLLHCALPSEVATARLFAESLARRQRVFAPRVDGSHLTFVEIRADTHWERSALGVLEPLDGEELSLAAAGDPSTVVLVPGLAFDERGARLGRGGGHYDRFLREARGYGGVVAIAMAFELQVVGEVPGEAHDEAVDLIVTEGRVIEVCLS